MTEESTEQERARIDRRERERLRCDGIDATDIRDLRNALAQDPVPDCEFDAVRVYRPLLEAVVESIERNPTPLEPGLLEVNGTAAAFTGITHPPHPHP